MGNEDGNDGVQFQQACFHLEKHTWKHVKSALRPWCCSRSVSLAMPRSSLMQSWRASATCPCLPSCLWCLWLVSLPPLALPRSWSQKCSHLTTWVQQDSSTIGPWQPGLWPCPSLPSLWLLSTCWSRWMVSRRTSERPGPSELLSKHEVHELHELQTSQNLLQKSTWSHQFNLHVIILLIQDFLVIRFPEGPCCDRHLLGTNRGGFVGLRLVCLLARLPRRDAGAHLWPCWQGKTAKQKLGRRWDKETRIYMIYI